MNIGESYKNSAGWFEIKTGTLNSKKMMTTVFSMQ